MILLLILIAKLDLPSCFGEHLLEYQKITLTLLTNIMKILNTT